MIVPFARSPSERKQQTNKEDCKRQKKENSYIYIYSKRTDLVETLTLKINIHLYKEREEICFFFPLLYKEVQDNRRIRSEFKDR